jgi:hypothetical protein
LLEHVYKFIHRQAFITKNRSSWAILSLVDTHPWHRYPALLGANSPRTQRHR